MEQLNALLVRLKRHMMQLKPFKLNIAIAAIPTDDPKYPARLLQAVNE